MRLEKITNLDCFRNFAHGAKIKTESGHYLGATSSPEEAEKIIKTYFLTEFFPEPVLVFFGGGIDEIGTWGYTFRIVTK